MYTITNPDMFRDKVRTRLSETIPDKLTCANIELGVYNYAIKTAVERHIVKRWSNTSFTELYISKMKSVMFNLSPELIASLSEPQQIAFMTHQEMRPDKWGAMIDKQTKKHEHMVTNRIQATTSDFTCEKCKQNNCTYYQMQIRSADEPMTTFVTCTDCEIRWTC